MKNPSYKTNRKALLIGKNASTEAILQDISITEAGVLTPRGAKPGTELELEFEIPALGEFTTLRLKTIVSHRHNIEDEIYLKLEFEELSDFDYEALSDFLAYKQRLIDMGRRRHPE